jgi:hypothetical protein
MAILKKLFLFTLKKKRLNNRYTSVAVQIKRTLSRTSHPIKIIDIPTKRDNKNIQFVKKLLITIVQPLVNVHEFLLELGE